MQKDTKQRAKIEILGYVTQFCLQNRIYREKESFSGYTHDVKAGDLVALTPCSFNKWYLSWVVDIRKRDDFFDIEYLLESIEDGSLAWWSNVSFFKFQDGNLPQKWRWTDKQFKLRDQWFQACYKKRGAYITLPCEPSFSSEGAVTFQTRTRFSFDENNKEITFSDWKKVRVKDLLEFYDSVVAWRETLSKSSPED